MESVGDARAEACESPAHGDLNVSQTRGPGAEPGTTAADRGCRLCGEHLHRTFVDLGLSPLSNSYVEPKDLSCPETFFPLHAYVCESCLLVQLQEVESAERIFDDYAYFSSYSDSWLRHSESYVDAITSRLGLGREHFVLELASNDGYLLQYFVEREIPVLGVEPAANVAKAALERGIPTVSRFFGEAMASDLVAEGRRADLVVANNVLAHVPSLNDFVRGIKTVLGPQGVATLEFPHLLRLMEGNQFDTIYHEHFSYFSFYSVERLFRQHGLSLFDVEQLPTHGGSLRIYAHHADDDSRSVTDRVDDLRREEADRGMDRITAYLDFDERVCEVKRRLLSFLIEARDAGKAVVGYGAPAKGNTLLNYCGVRTDLLDYTVDRSPHKQGRFLPGTRIPIHAPERIRETRPDYLLILPWNLKNEIMEQVDYIREWGGRFVVPIPALQVDP